MRSRTSRAILGLALALGACATSGETPARDVSAMRDYDAVGLASWYGEELSGARTASGERFDPSGISAAHRSLPLHTFIEVTALDTGRTILVRVNDRGPFHGNRLIDLSRGAAQQLGIAGRSGAPVRIRRVDPNATDRATLVAGRSVAPRVVASRETLSELRGRLGPRKPAVVQASATVAPGLSGEFMLQVGSFSSRDRARSLARRLNARVEDGGALWRVLLGPYRSASDALAARAAVVAQGYADARITRGRGSD